jgi:uncharacterized protein
MKEPYPMNEPLQQPNSSPSPVQPSERVAILDILRGFALLGILTVNMGMFNTPFHYLRAAGIEWWTSTPDRIAEMAIRFFAEGKFYTLFSFLFGLGFILFMERAERRVKRPRALFVQRLIVLLAIGLLHAFFLWYGDILVLYGASGFLLLLFYQLKPRTLVIWAAIMGVIFLVPFVLLLGLVFLMEAIDPGSWSAASQDMLFSFQERIDRAVYHYGQGSFAEVMAQRIEDLGFLYGSAIFAMPLILMMFLLGAYIGKIQLFQHASAHLSWIRKVWLWSLVIGVPMSVLKLYGGLRMDVSLPSFYDLMNYLGMVVGDPALSIFYMSSLVLLYHGRRGLKMLSPLAAIGRMALSNYLLQSVISTTLFYSYGFGLYGKVGPALGHLRRAIDGQPLLVEAFPLRACRMGLALAHLRQTSADA